MAERVDVVVVGSGFGGAVAAWRLAREGRSVLVLERGRAWPPGSFPRTPYRLRTLGFWEPGDGLHGLYDVRSFRSFDAIVASGLGGGSLIYANVMLRKDADTFADEDGRAWPVDRAALDPHYDRVEAVQRPAPYPWADRTPKTRAMLGAAAQAGLDARLPPLAIAFAPRDGAAPEVGAPLDGENLHGRPRLTCRLTGSCVAGCNDGAKQTVDLTFLSDAVRHGARIRCLTEATGLSEDGEGGWLVRYRQHVAAREGIDPELLDPSPDAVGSVRAAQVVLAAGTFGTTRLLLRNRAGLPRLSRALGTRFSMNGDLLAFVRGTPEALEPSVGPTITTSVSVGRGLVQDAGAPALADWLWQLTELPHDLWGLRSDLLRRTVDRLRGRRDTRIGGELARGFGSARASAAMMPLLGMGRDRPTGRMTLRGDELAVDWSERDSRDFYRALSARMRDVGGALGGRTTVGRLSRLTTVHPLGGCPMGADARDGVVDGHGRVFGHPGLHVADGSVLPGPVGPNPSFTIAALADRAAEAVLCA